MRGSLAATYRAALFKQHAASQYNQPLYANMYANQLSTPTGSWKDRAHRYFHEKYKELYMNSCLRGLTSLLSSTL